MADTVKTDLKAVIKDMASGQVYAGVAPAKPVGNYVVWRKVVGTPQNVLDGVPGMERHLFQIDLYSASYLDADELHHALRAFMRSATAFTCFESANRDFYESDTKLHRICSEWVVWAP